MDSSTKEPLMFSQMNIGVKYWKLLENQIFYQAVRNGTTTSHPPQVMYQFHIYINHNLRKMLRLHKTYWIFRVWTTLKPSGENCFHKALTEHFKYYFTKFLSSFQIVCIKTICHAFIYALEDMKFVTNWELLCEDTKYKIY